MDGFDAQIESKIKKLKALARGIETLTLAALGALTEKGKFIECYFCSHNQFVRDCPM
jgi:hypothetical protein